MPDMIISIDVLNRKKSAVIGNTSIHIDWKPTESHSGPLINEWGVWDLNSRVNLEIFWNELSGIFDHKTWNVMWLWERSPNNHFFWKNVVILWDPPTSRHDNSHPKGGGRIYEAKNSFFSGLQIKWKVTCLAGCYIN